MSTSAPPASARTTQESPAEAAATSVPAQKASQPTAIKEEPILEGKTAVPGGTGAATGDKTAVPEGSKAMAEEKKLASPTTGATAGVAKPVTAERPAAAAQSAGTAKKPKGKLHAVTMRGSSS